LVYSDVIENKDSKQVLHNDNLSDAENIALNQTLNTYRQNKFFEIVGEALSKTTVCNEIKIVVVNNIEYNIKPVSDNSTPNCPVTKIQEFTKEGNFIDVKLKNSDLSDFDLSDFSFSDVEKLQKLFLKIKGKYPAEHNLVFTYGHGSAFGIFKDIINIKNQEELDKIKNPDSALSENLTIKNLVSINELVEKARTATAKADNNEGLFLKILGEKVMLFDQEIKPPNKEFKPFGALTNEDFAHAIRTSFGVVNILVMDNCLMQNVYAQYALKDAVEYFIAPQTGITLTSKDLIGFNLNHFINNYITLYKGNVNPAELAREIINGFNVVNADTQTEEFNCFAVVSINLQRLYDTFFNDLKTYIKEFRRLLEIDPNFKFYMKDALRWCYGYERETGTGNTLIDFLDLLKQLTKRLNLNNNSEVQYDPFNYRLFYEKVNEYKLDYSNFSCFTGKELLIATKNNAVLSGLAVYFPLRKELLNRFIQPFVENDDDYLSAFDGVTEWRCFVEDYLKTMEGKEQ